MNHWCSFFSALLLLSAVSRWQVYEYWSGRVFWVPLSVLPSLWTVKETSIEKEKVLHILRNLRSLSMKDLMSVNCWMLQSFIHVLCSTWAAMWNSIPSSLSVITPCLMTQWRRLATGSFLPPLVFPLFTSDTFNHVLNMITFCEYCVH